MVLIWCLGAASLHLHKQHEHWPPFLPSHTLSSFPSPLPCPNKRKVFFFLLLLFIIITNYSHQIPPQAKPAPSSPPKLHGRRKHQPSNPKDMNKHPKPNDLDPSDGEHARPSKSTMARKKLTTAWKKVQKKGTKKQCIAHLFFIIIIIIDFYSTYRKTAAQRVAEDAQLTPYFPFLNFFKFFFHLLLFFYRSEQILEASC